MKKITSISIDEGLLKKAQEGLLNVSGVAETAIKVKLNRKEIEIKDICEYCNKEEKKATADNPIGLCWLCPDERWICDSCLSSKKMKVSTAHL